MKEKIHVFWGRFKPHLLYLLLFAVIATVVDGSWYLLHLWMYEEASIDSIDWWFLFILILALRYCIKSSYEVHRSKELSKEYTLFKKSQLDKLVESLQQDHKIITTMQSNLKVLDMVLNETIKGENGEESSIMKFKDLKSFANYIKAMNDFSLQYLENQINSKDNVKDIEEEDKKNDKS